MRCRCVQGALNICKVFSVQGVWGVPGASGFRFGVLRSRAYCCSDPQFPALKNNLLVEPYNYTDMRPNNTEPRPASLSYVWKWHVYIHAYTNAI